MLELSALSPGNECLRKDLRSARKRMKGYRSYMHGALV